MISNQLRTRWKHWVVTFKELLGPPLLVMILIELGMRNVDRVGEICESEYRWGGAYEWERCGGEWGWGWEKWRGRLIVTHFCWLFAQFFEQLFFKNKICKLPHYFLYILTVHFWGTYLTSIIYYSIILILQYLSLRSIASKKDLLFKMFYAVNVAYRN